MASAEAGPLGDAELDRLFQPLADAQGVALAVSGGADSTALLCLFAAWAGCAPAPPKAVVFTVDHGLRPGSGAEAAAVASLAARYGLAYEILPWLGAKPAGNLQAAARDARYGLLAAAMARHGLDTLVTAHHADDQAETVLLRLIRGSGVYGLAAMPAVSRFDHGRLVRPLLAVPKQRLVASLTARGVSWIEDPSNQLDRFQRVRLRRLMPVLAAEGLDRDRILATQRRMARAATALTSYADDLVKSAGRLHPGGWIELDATALFAAPEEVGLRALSRLVRHVGGRDYVPRAERLERLFAALGAHAGASTRSEHTLGGVALRLEGARLVLAREPGRGGLPSLRLQPGETAVWDARCTVTLAESAEQAVLVRALGPDGARQVAAGGGLGGVARPLAATAPSAWLDADLVACPAFGHAAAPAWGAGFTARFAPFSAGRDPEAGSDGPG